MGLSMGFRASVSLRPAIQATGRLALAPAGLAPAEHVRLSLDTHWANGGPTRLDNLALLCRRHHRAVHEEGYQVERDADGTLRFSTPRGQPLPEVPAPPAVPANPAHALVAAHRARGLSIDGWTGCPDWLGERLDLAWAIGVLHPAANPVAPRPVDRFTGVARSRQSVRGP